MSSDKVAAERESVHRLRGRSRSRGQRLVAGVLALLVVAAAVAIGVGASGTSSASYRTEVVTLTVPGGPTTPGTVDLDTTFYVPTSASATHRVPAVVVSPGFGSTKTSVAPDAESLAEHGYLAVAWTLRGFGLSVNSGKIALDAPDTEIADLSKLIDRIAARPDVLLDGPGDPRVGLMGESYGGGVALLGAAFDKRVDAIAPTITWNSLGSSFLPGGVFKATYASVFFATGPGGVCSRFVQRVCEAYTQLAQTGAASAATTALLAASSPATYLGKITVPTMLVQGEQDTLFPLSESLTTANALQAQGTTVHLAWLEGGHDAPFSSAKESEIRGLDRTWFDRWLKKDTKAHTGPAFRYDRSGSSQATSATLPGSSATTVALEKGSEEQDVSNPPGGRPTAVSSVPGAGALAGIASGLSLDIPGQTATWDSAVLKTSQQLVGAGQARLTVSSTTGTAVLFAKVVDVGPSGSTDLPDGQITPVRLTGLSETGSPVTVALPALAHTFPAGDRVRLSFATTDLAYAGPTVPATYGLTLDKASALTLPLGPVPGTSGYGRLALVAGLIALAVLALAAVLVGARRRRPPDLGDDDAPPVVITGLAKSYANGFRAVDGVDLTVERGQVLGLLGPNGAGKTTTLRMLAGLIAPSEGEVRLFGRVVKQGSPVLARIGLFIEGPGLLPHLSGMDNLTLYWTSTAPSMEGSYVEEALDVAGLGDAVHRPVRTYSQGMRQRLAIAQAMLGRPDLLVLDEPTNGLDPPQIKEVREVIQRIAATGRTVLVSSHLLAEVEQTCSHVAVMSRGKVVANGTVEHLLADDGTVRLDVGAGQGERGRAVLRSAPGVESVGGEGDHLAVSLDGASRASVVVLLVEAGVDVLGVSSRRRLEDVFLELLGTSG